MVLTVRCVLRGIKSRSHSVGLVTLVAHEASLHLYGTIEAKQDIQVKVALKRIQWGALFGAR